MTVEIRELKIRATVEAGALTDRIETRTGAIDRHNLERVIERILNELLERRDLLGAGKKL